MCRLPAGAGEVTIIAWLEDPCRLFHQVLDLTGETPEITETPLASLQEAEVAGRDQTYSLPIIRQELPRHKGLGIMVEITLARTSRVMTQVYLSRPQARAGSDLAPGVTSVACLSGSRLVRARTVTGLSGYLSLISTAPRKTIETAREPLGKTYTPN